MGVSSYACKHHPTMKLCVAVIAVIGFACNTANSYAREFSYGIGHGGAIRGLGDAQDYSPAEASKNSVDTVSSDFLPVDYLVTEVAERQKRSPHHHKKKQAHKRKHRQDKHKIFQTYLKSIRNGVQGVKTRVQNGFNLFAAAVQNAVGNAQNAVQNFKTRLRKHKEAKKRHKKQRRHKKHHQ